MYPWLSVLSSIRGTCKSYVFGKAKEFSASYEGKKRSRKHNNTQFHSTKFPYQKSFFLVIFWNLFTLVSYLQQLSPFPRLFLSNQLAWRVFVPFRDDLGSKFG